MNLRELIIRFYADSEIRTPLFIVLGSFLSVIPVFAEGIPEEGYLFAHFYNNGESGLHLAWSEDGLEWHLLNNGNSYLEPKVGESKLMRDPSLTMGPDGMFHMVWTTSWGGQTIGYASSADLINWSEQRALAVMGHEPRAENCWAPEIIWDPTHENYLILWSTTIPGTFPETALSNRRPTRNHRIYSATTVDFETFTPTRLHYDGGFNVIDAVLAQNGDDWLMVVKNEELSPVTQKNIRLLSAPTPYGPFSAPSEPISAGDWSEGPSIIRVGEYWHVYYDQHMIDEYGLVRTRDLVNWENMQGRTRFPKDVNHGSFVKVPGGVIRHLVNQTEAAADKDESAHVINVMDFGAVADGETLNTAAIQSSFKACSEKGGGTVRFPAGRYLTGSLELGSNLRILLDEGAVLIHAGSEGEAALLFAENQDNIRITGAGSESDLQVQSESGIAVHFINCRNLQVQDLNAEGMQGFYADRVEKLSMNNVRVAARRYPPFMIVDSQQVALDNISSASTSNEPIIALHNVRDASLENSTALRGTKTFLQVMGSATRNIRVGSNELSSASAAVITGPDVPDDSIPFIKPDNI